MDWWIEKTDPDFWYSTGFVKFGIIRYGTVWYGNTVPYELLVSFYLLIVGKKDGFEVIVVGRDVVVRRVDGVVEVVDDVPVVVRVVVEESGILGTL